MIYSNDAGVKPNLEINGKMKRKFGMICMIPSLKLI